MSWVGPVIEAVANLGSSGINLYSSLTSASENKKALDKATDISKDYTGQAAAYQQPYYQAGSNQVTTLGNMLNNGSYTVNPDNYLYKGAQPDVYQPTAFNFQEDPGYQFTRDQGLSAVNSNAAGSGSMLSGATLKALQKYGTGLANTTYNDAYTRYLSGQNLNMTANNNALGQYNANRGYGLNVNEAQQASATNDFNRRATIGNMGQTAANNLSNMYGTTGTNLANIAIGKGAVSAAGVMGAGNALSQGLINQGQAGSAIYNSFQNLNSNNNKNDGTTIKDDTRGGLA
jgi:hypothetical protein